MKKLKYLIFLFTFLLITDVNASTVNGSQADSPLYAVVSSGYDNTPVRLWTTNVFGIDIVDYGSVVNDYVYVTACTDMPTLGYSYSPFYNSTTGRTASASDIRYSANLTSKTCTFSNGTQGKVAYLKFRLISDLLNVPVSGNNTYLYNDYITLNIGTNSPFSFSIQNISALDSDLDIYSNDFDTSLLEQQNQQIINNQNQNSQNIINNQNQNTQDIINNQNSIARQQELQQEVCNIIDKGSIIIPDQKLLEDGSIYESSAYGITNYVKLGKSLTRIYGSGGTSAYFCWYDSSKTLLSCQSLSSFRTSNVSIPADAVYFRTSIDASFNRPQFKVCYDGNQATNNALNDLNDTLNSESTPNTNQDIQDMDNMVASDTPISDLITMPLTLINAYINGVDSTCSPVNLGSLLGTNLTLPCINIQERIGSNLWNTIDILCSIFLCYEIAMLFISAFDGITSLRDDFEGLYQPRHAYTGYQPKHGGGN